jgi:hypothetical protein
MVAWRGFDIMKSEDPFPSLTHREAEAMSTLPVESRPADRSPLRLAWVAAAACWLASTPLAAQDDLEKPPPIPPEASGDVPIPPKVPGEQITPRGGVPYYYIDTDGDGRLELDMDKQAMDPVQPVYWKIKEWK